MRLYDNFFRTLYLRETIDSLLIDYELVVVEAVSNGIDVLTQVSIQRLGDMND